MGEDTYKGELSDPLTLNLYTYVANNPLRYVDPSGHAYTRSELEYLMNYTMENQPSIGSVIYVRSKNILSREFAPMLNSNRFNYLFGLLTQTSPYANSRGNADWAKAQLLKAVDDYFKEQAFVLAMSSLGGLGTNVGRERAAGSSLRNGKVTNPCNCFIGGTKVQTDEVEKPIEEIEIGDKVLAKDDETGEMAYKEVEWLYQRDVEETYNITVGGEVITTTDEHPFWIVGKGWVESKNLVVGDVLTTTDDKELAIEKIEVKKEHKTVYNFKVKDFHTYFVSNLGIWTHNACGIVWPKTTSGKDTIKLLEKNGFEQVRQKGDHVIMKGPNGKTFPVPLHKELAKGTYKNIQKQAEEASK
jgi:predicted RNA binding protein YcfA (HicA-like mRNA interferase family)